METPIRWALLAALVAGLLAPGCSCSPANTSADAGADSDGAVQDTADADPCDFINCDPPLPDAGVVDAGPSVTVIRQVVPARGPVFGGTAVTIEGGGFFRGFAEGATDAKKSTHIFFGTNEASDFRIIDDDTLEVTSPPNPAGAADVSIKNPNGTTTCSGCFTYFIDLVVSSFTPVRGPTEGGTEVEIKGDGFDSAPTVLFAGKASPRVVLVDAHTVRATTPPGAAGPSDLRIFNKNGAVELRRAFEYFDAVALESLAPAYGPIAGGTVATLSGKGLTGVTSVTVGGLAASFTSADAQNLQLTTPAAAAAGPADVVVVAGQGSKTLKGGFVYFDPAATSLGIVGVVPAYGPARGGNRVTLVGSGLATASATFGGIAATVVSADANSLVVTVPAGAANTRVDLAVSAAAGQATLGSGYRYNVSLAGVTPTSGPAVGGQSVAVAGAGFVDGLELLFGAMPATSLARTDATHLTAATPPGSGAVDVVVRDPADHDNRDVLSGGYTFVEALSLGRIAPASGAIAGGTLVTVMGTGFAPGVIAEVGGSPLRDLKVLDAHTLTGRTPPGKSGPADVAVRDASGRDVAPGAFTYFDPRNGSGGSTGGPIAGTLNVTVLNSSFTNYGEPVAQATVMLGTDPTTPFQGLTDRRGQLTFSDPSLVKGQLVTVMKAGWESITVANQASENLTVYIGPNSGGSGSGMGPPPQQPSIVTGRVMGFKLPRSLKPGESERAEVWVAPQSLYFTEPMSTGITPDQRTQSGERWVVEHDGDGYSVFTGRGLRAIYAVYGIYVAATGQFTPLLMGVRRSVQATPDQPAVGQDIILDMHLDQTAPIHLDTLLVHVPGVSARVYAWLNLGGEGVIPMGRAAGTVADLSLPALPRLDAGNFTFLSQVVSGTDLPQSICFRKQYGELAAGLTIGPMMGFITVEHPTAFERFTGTLSWTMTPGAEPELFQVRLFQLSPSASTLVWTVILPGTARSTAAPGALWSQVQAGLAPEDLLVFDLVAVRAPRFDYAHWSYNQLSLDAWSSYTHEQGLVIP